MIRHISKDEYLNSKVITSSIENWEGWTEWYLNYSSQKGPRLFGDNRVTFKEIFGECDWGWRGEFVYHVWIMHHENETFLVNTSRRGTSVEVLVEGPSIDQDKINSFLDWLIDQMRKNNVKN